LDLLVQWLKEFSYRLDLQIGGQFEETPTIMALFLSLITNMLRKNIVLL
jgi:hypothetical protein